MPLLIFLVWIVLLYALPSEAEEMASAAAAATTTEASVAVEAMAEAATATATTEAASASVAATAAGYFASAAAAATVSFAKKTRAYCYQLTFACQFLRESIYPFTPSPCARLLLSVVRLLRFLSRFGVSQW